MVEKCKRISYRPNARKLTQLFIVGFVSSVVALLLTAVLTLVGAPVTDLSYLFGGTLFAGVAGETHSPPSLAAQWGGLLLYFLLASLVFPLLFDYLADREVLTNRRWLKGFVWGIFLWVFAEGVLKPLMGYGFFSNNMTESVGAVMVSFIVWLAYAFTMETSLRIPIAHELNVPARTDHRDAA
ncbi:MAG: hypothetical protein HY537_10315 [Deltaproteobacteria bacterium]|nr:hypothetical protein [Deltaproteobacteria bacterium]